MLQKGLPLSPVCMNKKILSLMMAAVLAVCCMASRAEARVCVSVNVGVPVCVPRVCLPVPRVYVPAPRVCVPVLPPPCPRYDHYHYHRPHHSHHHHCGPRGGHHGGHHRR